MDDVLVIQCPDCESTLKVDRETGAVLSHEPAAVKRRLGSLEEAAAENARRKERAQDLFAATVEREKHTGTVNRAPEREEIDVFCNEQLVVELYSR